VSLPHNRDIILLAVGQALSWLTELARRVVARDLRAHPLRYQGVCSTAPRLPDRLNDRVQCYLDR